MELDGELTRSVSRSSVRRARSTDLRNRPAVNNHHLAVHEAVAITDHEGRVFSQLSGTTEPACRRPEVVHLEESFRQSLGQVRVEDARGNRVDEDAEGAGFAREALGKADHRGLRSGVVD